jgi:hypothetical protein
VIGELDLDECLTSRDTINGKLRTILDEASNKWGVKVNRVELQDINPPRDIREAMEKQMRAERDKRAQIIDAEGSKRAACCRPKVCSRRRSPPPKVRSRRRSWKLKAMHKPASAARRVKPRPSAGDRSDQRHQRRSGQLPHRHEVPGNAEGDDQRPEQQGDLHALRGHRRAQQRGRHQGNARCEQELLNSSLFIGSNNFHYSYAEDNAGPGNTWNGHLMPGFEAVYGYNLVNISHFDVTISQQKLLYERPVLIKTLYYPSFSIDTLHHVPIMRKHFLITLFDEDTNMDGHIDTKDLRRMHLFDVNGIRQKDPVPDHYSVISSEYDPGNDRMTVLAALDVDRNGRHEDTEPVHIHWIDLKDPTLSGRQY